jgi:Cysteine-rich CPCC
MPVQIAYFRGMFTATVTEMAGIPDWSTERPLIRGDLDSALLALGLHQEDFEDAFSDAYRDWLARRPAAPRFPCPCCGFLTLAEEPPGTFEICEVCGWEDDAVQFHDHAYEGGANHSLSLDQARTNYAETGSSRMDRRSRVREPDPEEWPPVSADAILAARRTMLGPVLSWLRGEQTFGKLPRVYWDLRDRFLHTLPVLLADPFFGTEMSHLDMAMDACTSDEELLATGKYIDEAQTRREVEAVIERLRIAMPDVFDASDQTG